jgi:hypothetical protein
VSSKCFECHGFYHVICIAKSHASPKSALIPSEINCPNCSAPTQWYTVLRNVVRRVPTLEVADGESAVESDDDLSEGESNRLFNYAKKLMIESNSENESKSDKTDFSDDDEVIVLQRRKPYNSQYSPSRKVKRKKSVRGWPNIPSSESKPQDIGVPKLQPTVNESLIIPPDLGSMWQSSPNPNLKQIVESKDLSRNTTLLARPKKSDIKSSTTETHASDRSRNSRSQDRIILKATSSAKVKVAHDRPSNDSKLGHSGGNYPNLSFLTADSGNKKDKSGAKSDDSCNECYNDGMNSTILDFKTDPAYNAVLRSEEVKGSFRRLNLKNDFDEAFDGKAPDSNTRFMKKSPISLTSMQENSEVISLDICSKSTTPEKLRETKNSISIVKSPFLNDIPIEEVGDGNDCEIQCRTPTVPVEPHIDNESCQKQKSSNKQLSKEAISPEQKVYRGQASLLLDTTVEDVQDEKCFDAAIELSPVKPVWEKLLEESNAIILDKTVSDKTVSEAQKSQTPCVIGYVGPNACKAPFSESPKFGFKGYCSPSTFKDAYSQSPGYAMLNHSKAATKKLPKLDEAKEDNRSFDSDPGRSDPALSILSPLNNSKRGEIEPSIRTPSQKQKRIESIAKSSKFQSPGDSARTPIIIDDDVLKDTNFVREMPLSVVKDDHLKVSNPYEDRIFQSSPLKIPCSRQRTPSSSSQQSRSTKRKRKCLRNFEDKSPSRENLGDVDDQLVSCDISSPLRIKRSKHTDEKSKITPDWKASPKSPPSEEFLRLQTPPQQEGPPRLSLNMFALNESDSDGHLKPQTDRELTGPLAKAQALRHLKPPKKVAPLLQPSLTLPACLLKRKHNRPSKKKKKGKREEKIIRRDKIRKSPPERDTDSSSGSEVPFAERLRRRLQR